MRGRLPLRSCAGVGLTVRFPSAFQMSIDTLFKIAIACFSVSTVCALIVLILLTLFMFGAVS